MLVSLRPMARVKVSVRGWHPRHLLLVRIFVSGRSSIFRIVSVVPSRSDSAARRAQLFRVVDGSRTVGSPSDSGPCRWSEEFGDLFIADVDAPDSGSVRNHQGRDRSDTIVSSVRRPISCGLGVEENVRDTLDFVSADKLEKRSTPLRRSRKKEGQSPRSRHPILREKSRYFQFPKAI